jgi:hypothetical protein
VTTLQLFALVILPIAIVAVGGVATWLVRHHAS